MSIQEYLVIAFLVLGVAGYPAYMLWINFRNSHD